MRGVRKYTISLVFLILVASSIAINGAEIASPKTLLIPNADDVNLLFLNASVNLTRGPIVVGEPVIWNMIIDKDNNLYSTKYSTFPVSLTYLETLDVDRWTHKLLLSTLYEGTYKDFTISHTIPGVLTSISPELSYSQSGNKLTIRIPTLNRFLEINLTGNFTNLTNQTSRMNFLPPGQSLTKMTTYGEVKVGSDMGSIVDLEVNDDLEVNFTIRNLTNGSKANVTISLPFKIPAGVEFYLWKQEKSVPYTIDESRTSITLQLEDGVMDDDGIVNGVIRDPLRLFKPTISAEIRSLDNNSNRSMEAILHDPDKDSPAQVLLSTSSGNFRSIRYVDPTNTINTPAENFEFKLISFEIENLTNGSSTNVTITYPRRLPSDVTYWKFDPNTASWTDYPIILLDDNTIQITLTDGGFGDSDGLVNGVISDPGGPSGTWANDSWNYRQNITITNNVNLNVTDYQVELSLTSSNVGANFNWSDVNDSIRFYRYNVTNESEEKLSYWIESWNETARTATVWVRIDYLIAGDYDAGIGTGKTLLFMYYDNDAATSESNATATFLLFDDFSSDTISTGYWNTMDSDGSPAATFNISSGRLNLSAAGADTWTANDEYGSVYANVSGNFEATVKLISQENTNSWAKAGIMLKNNMSDAGSAVGYVFMAITPDNGDAWQRDEDEDGFLSSNSNTGGTSTYPRYLRLIKNSTILSGFASADGTTWSQVGSDVNILSTNSFQDVGLSVTSHDTNILSTVLFDDFKVRRYVETAPYVSYGEEVYAGKLNVSIDRPVANKETYRNTAFTMNGTANCTRGDCQNVSVSYQYYATATPTLSFVETSKSDFNSSTLENNSMIWNNSLLINNSVSDNTPWWDLDWNFRQLITVTNSDSSTTYYTQKIIINSSNVGTNFNWSNASSIRFVQYNQTGDESNELDYWIKDWSSSSQNATIYVLIKSLANGANKIWMYYGNSAVTNESSYEGAFLVADKFTGSSLSDLWATVDNDGTTGTSFGVANDTLYIDGNGADTWTTSDQFAAVFQTVTGDFNATAKINYQENTNAWAKAGLMIRNDIRSPGSSPGYVFMVITPGNDFAWQRDSDDDGYLDTNTGGGTTTYPAYVRVIKSGTSFSGYYSTDGQSWTLLSTATIGSASATQDVALATTSHSTGVLGNVTYDYIEVKRYLSSTPVNSFGVENELNFSKNASYISSALDTGSSNIAYETINWNDITNSNTSITVYTRTSAGADSAWFDPDWPYRTSINVTNTAGDQYEYQIYINKNFSSEFSESKIEENCSDVLITYYNSTSDSQEEVSFFTDYCNLSSEDNATFWAKIPYLENDTITKVYLYYGNSSKTDRSDIVSTFSYSSARTIGYVVSDTLASQGVEAMSLSDSNTVAIGSTSQTLSNILDTYTFASADVDIWSRVNSTKLAQFEGAGATNVENDIIVPVSWAGTEFLYGGQRGTDEYCMLSPWGDATVTLYQNGVQSWSGTIDSSGTCMVNDTTTGDPIRIVSDIPILAYHQSTDSWAFYPATTLALYGPSASNYIYGASGVSTLSVAYAGSGGTTGSQTINPHDTYDFGGPLTTGGDGGGEAVILTPNATLLGAIQQADGDGTESTVLVPRKEMSTQFGSPFDSEYVAIVSPYNANNCSLYNSTGYHSSTQTSASGSNGVYKACFGCGSDTVIINGPWRLQCDKPVWAYYEQNGPTGGGEETNMLGYKQMRQFVYPEPSVVIGNEDNYTYTVTDTDNFPWSPWFLESNGAAVQSPDKRYIQYKVLMTTTNSKQTPQFQDITITYKASSGVWTDIQSSGTLFTASAPYECGMLNNTHTTCNPTLEVNPLYAGNYSLRLVANSSHDNVSEVVSSTRNISVWVQPILSYFASSVDPITRDQNTTLSVTLLDETSTPMAGFNLSFYDETGNGSRYFIGWDETDSSGLATIVYTMLSDATYATHTFNVSYAGSTSDFYKPIDATTTALVSSTPVISNITVTPPDTGFGLSLEITANVTDEVGLDDVLINITDGSIWNTYSMSVKSTDIFNYTFNDSWAVGNYNFTIIANNTDSAKTVSSVDSFSILVHATFNYSTKKDRYKNNEVVYLNNDSNWHYQYFIYRIPISVENTAGDQKDYQIYVERDLTSQYSNGHIQQLCQDVRFSYINASSGTESPIDFYTDYCNLSTSTNATFWVQVPYLKNNSNTTVYLYFGNSSASSVSNLSSTFTYSSPKTIAYVVSTQTDAQGVIVVSHEDNNSIVIGTDSYLLNATDTQTVAQASITLASALNATKLLNVEGTGTADDMIVPVSWASTKFVLAGLRATSDRFCMLSPWGDATVTIYNGSSSVWSGTVDNSGTCQSFAMPDPITAEVDSDIPILLFFDGTNGQDAYPVYPASDETIYGASVSNYMYVSSGRTSGTAYCYGSDSNSGSITVSATSQGDCRSELTAGTQGSGAAAKISGSKISLGAIQQADSDGTESTVLVPRKEFGTIFGSANDAQYISVVTDKKGVNCSVYQSGTFYVSNVSTGYDSQDIYQTCFDCGDGSTYVTGPWKMVCDSPVWAYYEPSDDQESTMFGYKQMRQYVYPEPTLTYSSPMMKEGLQNNGTTNFTGYLRMIVQQWTGSAWTNILPPVIDQDYHQVDAGEVLDISSLWKSAGGWNTTNRDPGWYRVYSVLEDADRNTLIDTSNSQMIGTYNFSIIRPIIIVSNFTYENGYDHSIEEYEVGDTIDWINVTVYPQNNTAYDANVTLSILNDGSSYVSWGPVNETKLCGDLTENETCENKWDNSSSGYLIPEDASAGEYNFYWNVLMQSYNGVDQTNSSMSFLLHNLKATGIGALADSRIYKPNTTQYNFTFNNTWSRNITSINITINCPSLNGFSCNSTTSGNITELASTLGSRTTLTATFNVSANASVTSGNYEINVTLKYTNPAGEQRTWKEIGGKTLEVRTLGILVITDNSHPTSVTRGNSYNFSAFENNSADDQANNTWLNYTLPSSWSVTDGNSTLYTSSLAASEIQWNNITTSIGIGATTGSSTIRLDSSADDGRADFLTYSLDVYATTNTTLSASPSLVNRGENTTLLARLVLDNGTSLMDANVTFYDNTTGKYIGSAVTNSTGHATVDYYINLTSLLGIHTINATCGCDEFVYYYGSNDTTTIDVHSKPNITNVGATPSTTGFGKQISITADVIDDDGADSASVNITYPNGTSKVFDMVLSPPQTFNYVFSDTWTVGTYTYAITGNDTTGAEETASSRNFSITSKLIVGLQTVNKTYGQNEQVNLTPPNSTSWWSKYWPYRLQYNISNTAENLYEYQVYVNHDFSDIYSQGYIDRYCSGVRFTYVDNNSHEEEIDFFTDYCDLAKENNATFWVQVPFIENNTNTTLNLYYGNTSASSSSNISATFSYSQARTIGYVVSQRMVDNGVTLVSLADDNFIQVGSNNFSLDDLETGAVSSGLQLSTPIKAKKLTDVEGAGSVDDIIVPVSWASTEFLYGGMRDSLDRFCMLSPWGTATVSIYNGTDLEWSGSVDSLGTCQSINVLNYNTSRITSSIPILVFRDGAGQSRDSWAFYPSTTLDLYGASASSYVYVAAGTSPVSATCYDSDGNSPSLSLNADTDNNCAGLTTGAQGTGAAVKVTSNNPVGVIQQADSDGAESTVFVPRKEFGTVFGSSRDLEYVVAVSVYDDTNCSVYDSGGLVESAVVSGSSSNKIYKVCFNCTTSLNDDYLSGPWKMVCDKPVWAYYEESSTDDEANMLSYKQMRQYVYPEPTLSQPVKHKIGSRIYNKNTTNHTAYLLMKVQHYSGGNWDDMATIFDDVANSSNRSFSSDGLLLDGLWNSVSWDTSNNEEGLYRAYAELQDPDGNVLINDDGSSIKGYWEFNISTPAVNINISNISVYKLTDSLEANWHIYTTDYVDSGINKTFNLQKDNIYRFEVEIENIGSSVWNINGTNLTYTGLNDSWFINTSDHIWYSNASTISSRRSDSTREGGSFNGTVLWDQKSYPDTVAASSKATFFFIVNVSSEEDIQILFEAEQSTFNRNDYSTLHIIALDTTPPQLYNDIYNVTNQSIIRGGTTDLYARWNEKLTEANVTYSTTSSSTFATLQNSSPQNSQNWTNFTLQSYSTWYLGNHTAKLIATDESGNVNDTLSYLWFLVWGRAQILTGSINASSINVSQKVLISCKVTDETDSDSAIENYIVSFYNGTGLIGTNITNSSGWATYTYTDNSAGSETLTCNITQNSTTHYKIDSSNEKTFTLTTTETVPPNYDQVSGPTVANKGTNILLSTYWHDNFALSNAILSTNSSGSFTNETPQSLSGTDSWGNFTYSVPTTMNPGLIAWKQYANDTSGNYNQTAIQQITIWGWSHISSESLNPTSMQTSNTTTMTCRIQDDNSTSAISGYTVTFSYKNDSDSTYTVLGTNTTNSTGYAKYSFVVDVAGTYDVKCNITDDNSLLYNDTGDNYGILTLNVVAGSDYTPPKIVGNNYSINDTLLYYGDCLKISGLWDESINYSYIEYNISSTQTLTKSISAPYTANWTNTTICTNSSWTPGNLSIKLFAKDEAGNTNDTLETKYFTFQGRSQVHLETPTGNNNRSTVTIVCNVTNYDTGEGLSGYSITFYDGDLGFSIGTNSTNSSGKASITYDFTSHDVGPDDLSCQISDEGYYTAQSPTLTTGTVYWYGILNPSISIPANNSIIHRSQTQTLNATIVDEFGAAPKDENGNDATITIYWYNSSDDQLATGNPANWSIPDTYSLGADTIRIDTAATYYYSGTATNNITIYAYADISLLSPASSTYPENRLLNITCKVSDNETSSGIGNYPVVFYANSSSIASSTTNSTGHAYTTINTSDYSDGVHNLSCLINDNSSLHYNKSVSEDNVLITVDSTGPTIQYNPSTDANGSKKQDWILVNVTATDSNLDSVRLYWQGTPESFQTNSGSYYWSNKTGLTDGSYTFYGFVNDTSGNENQTSNRTVTIDTTAPTITILSPQNDTWSQTTSLELNISLNEAGFACVYAIDSGSNSSMDKINSTHFNATATLTLGQHNITFYCNDSVNNTGTALLSTGVDTVSPAITLFNPANASASNLTSTTFKCQVSDDLNVVNVSLYSDYPGSWQLIETNSSGLNNTNYTFSKTVPEGNHLWSCQACDHASCDLADNFTYTVDTTAPTVSILHPENDSYSSTTIDLNYTYVENLNVSVCWYVLDGGSKNLIAGCQNTTLAGLSQAQHNVTIYVNDSANNTGHDSVIFTVDTTPPKVSIVHPVNGTNYTTTNNLDLNFTRSDNIGLSACWYNLDSGLNTTISGCANTTISGLSNSNHTLTLYANDTAGNLNSTNIWFNVDVSELVATEEAPINGSHHKTSWTYFNVTTNKAATTCNYTLDSGSFVSMTNDTPLHWSVNVSSLSEGSHDVSYSCADATNTSTTDKVYFTIDLTNPTLTVISPTNKTYNSNSVALNYTAHDTNAITCSYSLNGAAYTDLASCANTTLSSLAEGSQNVTVKVVDQAGNENASTIYFGVDTVAPNITIISPTNTTYATQGIDLNISTDESTNTCWFTEDYSTNTTMNRINSTYYNYSTTFSDGQHIVIFFCNDSVNNIGNNNITFSIDTTGPVVTFVSPTPSDGGAVAVNYTVINITTNEATDSAILEWQNSTGKYNYSMTRISSTSFWYNMTSLSDATYNYVVYTNDSYGNDAQTSSRSVLVSTVAPIITIYSPTSTTYLTSVIDLNVTSNKDIDRWWFELDGENFSLTPNTTIAADIGSSTLTVYATDLSGQLGNSSVTFSTDITRWDDGFSSFTGMSDASSVKTQGSAEINFCWGIFLNESALPQDQNNTCWLYKKELNITSSTSLTDYPTRLVLNLSSEATSGKARTDCSDLRFTYQNSSSETEIDYWIEDCNNLNNLTVWVKVPVVGTSTKINVYYGNDNATSKSDGSNVFYLFDDFSALDSGDWGSNAANWDSLNGVSWPTASGTSSEITSTYDYVDAYTVELKFKGNSSSGASGYFDLGNSAGNKYLRFYLEPADNRLNLYDGVNNYYSINTSAYQTYSLKSDFTGDNYTLITNYNTTALSLSAYASGSRLNPKFYSYYVKGLYLDYLAVRKYSYSEPSIDTIGSEQTPVVNATVQSILLSPSPLVSWLTFTADTTIPSGTNITFGIYNSSNSSLCGVLTASQLASGYSVCANAQNYDSLYLFANLTTDTTLTTPTIDWWNVSWTDEANITMTVIDSSQAQITDSNISLYNSGTLQATDTGSLEYPVSINELYDITTTTSLSSGTLKTNISGVNVTTTATVEHQIVESYSGSTPSRIINMTPLILVNISESFSYAELTIPKAGVDVNRILHCKSWDKSSTNCDSWEVNVTGDYDFSENATHIILNVTSFDGYAGAALDNVSPVINSHNATPSSATQGENITIYANVTDNYEVDTVIVTINGTNHTMTNNAPDIFEYEFNTAGLSLGTHNYAIYANDTAGNNATSQAGNYTVLGPVDLQVSDIIFSDDNASEDDVITVSVNISNNGSKEAENFSLKVNVSLWNGTWNLNDTLTKDMINVSGNSYELVNFSWTVKIGTYRFLANADYLDNVSESNESNNDYSENYTTSSWQVLYGNYNYTIDIGSASNYIFNRWSVTAPAGTVYFYDSDAVFDPWNLEPLNGTNDLSELDAALGLTGFSDSVSSLFDVDGDNISDRTGTFFISGSYVSGVPIINTTNTSSFVTGLMYDSGDGVGYDGSQDVVFVTSLNASHVGKYGTYDYEIRLPSPLKDMVGVQTSVSRTEEII